VANWQFRLDKERVSFIADIFYGILSHNERFSFFLEKAEYEKVRK